MLKPALRAPRVGIIKPTKLIPAPAARHRRAIPRHQQQHRSYAQDDRRLARENELKPDARRPPDQQSMEHQVQVREHRNAGQAEDQQRKASPCPALAEDRVPA
jgi:hypothetical protein